MTDNSIPFCVIFTGSVEETLHKDTVYSILFHPTEMEVYSTLVGRTKEAWNCNI